MKKTTPGDSPIHTTNRLTSRELASLIIDVLRDAALVKDEAVLRAIELTTEEIDARKALGDY